MQAGSVEVEMEDLKQQTAQQEVGQLRGLYSKVNISVRTLNLIIVVLIAALIACMAFGVSNAGFDVTFDTQGGTVVEPQKRMHGELLDTPQTPTREGFVFDGWYRDPAGTVRWETETDTVTESMTLYAGWIEK